MNDFETLEELREMVRYAKQDVEDWASRVDEARRTYDTRFQTLRKAEERYVAHLEMMAAGVKQ